MTFDKFDMFKNYFFKQLFYRIFSTFVIFNGELSVINIHIKIGLKSNIYSKFIK